MLKIANNPKYFIRYLFYKNKSLRFGVGTKFNYSDKLLTSNNIII